MLKNNQVDYANDLAAYDLLLEYGVATETQISLVSLGLSRASALALSEFRKETDLTEEDCLAWLKRGEHRNYNLSAIMGREIEELLKFVG